ncbi:hypothetical protein [Aeoliella sp.]|uniref:hypothetical protein n=1 Tax=Aeoliella sp. TaxID=2795800 RepID=UPI003CCBF907
MTWYASQIITTGDPSIIAAIDRNPIFAGNVFHVKNPIEHNWHTPEVKHSVPDEGLIFIRPICDPADHIAEWHGDELLSWDRFENAPGEEVLLEPQAIAQRYGELEIVALVATDILRATKKLNSDTKVPVAYYYCFCWGGDVEIEFAWIFDGSERVLIRLPDDEPPDVNRLLEVDPETETVYDEDVLVRTLRSLKCELPTPFFAPHARNFPWVEHRV